MEKVGDNVFKYTFGSKDDKEGIFKGGPWFLQQITSHFNGMA